MFCINRKPNYQGPWNTQYTNSMASELEWLNKMNIAAADNHDLRTIPVTKEISV